MQKAVSNFDAINASVVDLDHKVDKSTSLLSARDLGLGKSVSDAVSESVRKTVRASLAEVRHAAAPPKNKKANKSRALETLANHSLLIARVGVGLLPFALVAVALAQVLGLVSAFFGLPGLFAWGWSAFAATKILWVKCVIALITLGGAVFTCFICYRLGLVLYEKYKYS